MGPPSIPPRAGGGQTSDKRRVQYSFAKRGEQCGRDQVGRRAGVLGSAVIQDRVTDLVDLDAVVALTGVGA